MMDLNNIKYCLNNENGGPHIEELMVVAVSLTVSVGLFLFGKYVYHWYASEGEYNDKGEYIESAAGSVNDIPIADGGGFKFN